MRRLTKYVGVAAIIGMTCFSSITYANGSSLDVSIQTNEVSNNQANVNLRIPEDMKSIQVSIQVLQKSTERNNTNIDVTFQVNEALKDCFKIMESRYKDGYLHIYAIGNDDVNLAETMKNQTLLGVVSVNGNTEDITLRVDVEKMSYVTENNELFQQDKISSNQSEVVLSTQNIPNTNKPTQGGNNSQPSTGNTSTSHPNPSEQINQPVYPNQITPAGANTANPESYSSFLGIACIGVVGLILSVMIKKKSLKKQ